MAFLSMTTPLEERIDRWATSGKATRILLHPKDFLKVAKKIDAIEEKYNLPVEALGGEKGLKSFIQDSKAQGFDDDIVDVDLSDILQGDE